MISEAVQLADRLPPPWNRGFLAQAQVLQTLGEGKRSTVFGARWQGREVAIKLYQREAAAKHSQRHPLPVARFEFLRNRALCAAPGLEMHIARPIAYLCDGDTQVFVQERVQGELFETYRLKADPAVLKQLVASLRQIVAGAHAAGVYDLDLHPNNVLVVSHLQGPPQLKLYDFNKIPFHEYAPNPIARLQIALGLVGPASRDLRRLHLFTDPPGTYRFGTRRP